MQKGLMDIKEETKFIRVIAQGLLDIKEEKEFELSEVKKKLGIT